MGTLTKSGIIDEIVLNTGLSRKEASDGIETFIEIIKQALEKKEPVSISGFGKWKVREKTARRGRNPKTAEEIVISPRSVVTFSLSNVLRSKLTSKG
ncbi:MAG TPA: integration host factor subunit alpha [Deltaproteobacteria bacterium]|jgi:integration host factor subunit alpha|nr:integration host factor subunit alpha [Deltaproteobacteria bacterium]HPJ92689.1 integration host factor subunit alpha [Deltaproteobacteria bacterium]HPR50526.1 integration host factor subunit alpha [Deltaproteobacteria bacterium]